MILLTNKDIINLNKSKIEYVILHPNIFKLLNAEETVLEIIAQLKSESYKFLDGAKLKQLYLHYSIENTSRKSIFETLLKDTLIIKAIVIILEAIYDSSFSSRISKPSLNQKSALIDAKIKLKGAT